MIRIELLYSAILLISFPICAFGCPKKDVMLVEIDQHSRIYYDGNLIDGNRELSSFRDHCAKKIVVLAHPDAKIQKITDVAFYSSKFDVKARSDNFHVFIVSVDRSRMIFLPTMASVRYSRDVETLKKLISSPPVEDNFL